jgi:hypothetical protein
MTRLTRRALLRTTACGLGWLASRPWFEAMAADRQRDATPPKFCWARAIGRWASGKIRRLSVAREIGLDGVEVSFGEPGRATICATPMCWPRTAKRPGQPAAIRFVGHGPC